MALTYRTADPAWGDGKGAPLTSAEVDSNFHALDTRVRTLETTGLVTPESVARITSDGASATVLGTRGSNLGTFTLPMHVPSGAVPWQAATAYALGALLTAPDQGDGPVYITNTAFTSAATFAEDKTAGRLGLFAGGGGEGARGAAWSTARSVAVAYTLSPEDLGTLLIMPANGHITVPADGFAAGDAVWVQSSRAAKGTLLAEGGAAGGVCFEGQFISLDLTSERAWLVCEGAGTWRVSRFSLPGTLSSCPKAWNYAYEIEGDIDVTSYDLGALITVGDGSRVTLPPPASLSGLAEGDCLWIATPSAVASTTLVSDTGFNGIATLTEWTITGRLIQVIARTTTGGWMIACHPLTNDDPDDNPEIGLPSPIEGTYLRANSNGWEIRTPGQVLSDIGGAPSTHVHDSYLPIVGGTVLGSIAVQGAIRIGATSQAGWRLYGVADSGSNGLAMLTSGGNAVHGNDSGTGTGIYGLSSTGFGVHGVSSSGVGVNGVSTSASGIKGSSTGYIGVQGVSSNSWGAHFSGLYGLYAQATNSTNPAILGVNTSANTSCNLGYGAYAFYGIGTGYISGAYTGSDERLKENIADLTNATALIMQIRVREFDWKENTDARRGGICHDYGVIAQEVEQFAPFLIRDNAAPQDIPNPTLNNQLGVFKVVNYGTLIPFLVRSIQEQQLLIDEIRERIRLLEL